MNLIFFILVFIFMIMIIIISFLVFSYFIIIKIMVLWIFFVYLNIVQKLNYIFKDLLIFVSFYLAYSQHYVLNFFFISLKNFIRGFHFFLIIFQNIKIFFLIIKMFFYHFIFIIFFYDLILRHQYFNINLDLTSTTIIICYFYLFN